MCDESVAEDDSSFQDTCGWTEWSTFIRILSTRGLWPFITTQDDREWDSFSSHMLSLIFMCKNLCEVSVFHLVRCQEVRRWSKGDFACCPKKRKGKTKDLRSKQLRNKTQLSAREQLSHWICFVLLWRFLQTAQCLDESCEAAVDSAWIPSTVSGLNIPTTSHRLHCRHTHVHWRSLTRTTIRSVISFFVPVFLLIFDIEAFVQQLHTRLVSFFCPNRMILIVLLSLWADDVVQHNLTVRWLYYPLCLPFTWWLKKPKEEEQKKRSFRDQARVHAKMSVCLCGGGRQSFHLQRQPCKHARKK